jgi:hypothetical protein
VRIVVKSLRETPQSLPVPAGDVALAAMQRAFPCPGRGRDLTDAHRAVERTSTHRGMVSEGIYSDLRTYGGAGQASQEGLR